MAAMALPDTILDLAVRGMSCASCVGRVERALAAVPGVVEAHVNLATERATIRGRAAPAALVAAIEETGYEAAPVETSPAQAESERESREAETVALKHSTIIAALATAPLVVIEMGSHLSGAFHHAFSSAFGEGTLGIVSFLLATMVMAGPGLRFQAKGWPLLMRLAPDMNSLVALGTLAAYGFSVVATFAPGLLPAGAAQTYYEASAVIVTLVLAGRWFEAKAKGRTSEAIRRLVTLQPRNARILRDGREEEVAVEAVRAGDVVALRPGERVPVDGEVAEGASYIDESMMTGEPVPAFKGVGAEVLGGTVNGAGALRFRATRVGAGTLLAEIIRTVEAAQGAKLPVQDLVDRVTLRFVPAVMAAAALTFAAWLAFGPEPALSHALVNAVAVLIIACPCAMGLATPTAIMVGTGKAAEAGILFRRGDALQALQGARIVTLDKTGTLTEGRPMLTDIAITDGFDEAEVLRLAAAAESRSEHPVAAAIVAAARARGLTIPQPATFEAVPGHGIRAEVEGRRVEIGAARLMPAVDLSAFEPRAAALAEDGRTPLYVAVDGKPAALLAVADPIKPTTPAAIRAFEALGLRVAMVTGDDARTAQAVARRLGIREVLAEILPAGKAEAVRTLQARGPVAFVGDGINDAPALAQADIGIALGTGTDIAIESAELVLMSGDLMGVAKAVALSRATLRTIRENLAFAFAYNALLIPVAAGALYPVFGLTLSPMIAGLAMALSSVSVLANALRLRRIPLVGAPR